jgi:hypothetical protein
MLRGFKCPPKAEQSTWKLSGRVGLAVNAATGSIDPTDAACPAGQRAIIRFKTVEKDMNLRVYRPSACPRCYLKERCSPSDYRRIRRWEHEHMLEAMQRRLDRKPDAMIIRKSTVEDVFGTIKHWMGATHFLTRTLGRVSTEMSLQVLAYNLKRVMNILGVVGMMKAMRMAGS